MRQIPTPPRPLHHGPTAPSEPGPPHYRCFTTTHWHTTIDRTSLDEGSVRRRDFYPKTHNTYKKQTPIAFGGIRIRNPCKRAAADARLWSRNQRDRLRQIAGRTEYQHSPLVLRNSKYRAIGTGMFDAELVALQLWSKLQSLYSDFTAVNWEVVTEKGE